ncbi:MAG: iron-containing redox enzyme family protein [Planctomycetota bacterium]
MSESRNSSNEVAERFLSDLDAELAAHRAVRHPLLDHFAHRAPVGDFLRFGLHHRHVVERFTHYLELLLLRADDTRDKLWIAKVLVDEFGSGTGGQDHGSLYRSFLGSLGADDLMLAANPHSEAAQGFVREHERICGESAWLSALGALGPGHEWALPRMFGKLHAGLRRLGFQDHEVFYFPCHLEQDVHHGAWLREALVRHATTARAQQQIREGALRSLVARERLWDAIWSEIDQGEGVESEVSNADYLRGSA